LRIFEAKYRAGESNATKPGSNPTIVSYNARAGKIYTATISPWCVLITKNDYFCKPITMLALYLVVNSGANPTVTSNNDSVVKTHWSNTTLAL
jgi:hypothetical protein